MKALHVNCTKISTVIGLVNDSNLGFNISQLLYRELIVFHTLCVWTFYNYGLYVRLFSKVRGEKQKNNNNKNFESCELDYPVVIGNRSKSSLSLKIYIGLISHNRFYFIAGSEYTKNVGLALNPWKRTVYDPSLMPQLSIEFTAGAFRVPHNILPVSYK